MARKWWVILLFVPVAILAWVGYGFATFEPGYELGQWGELKKVLMEQPGVETSIPRGGVDTISWIQGSENGTYDDFRTRVTVTTEFPAPVYITIVDEPDAKQSATFIMYQEADVYKKLPFGRREKVDVATRYYYHDNLADHPGGLKAGDLPQ